MEKYINKQTKEASNSIRITSSNRPNSVVGFSSCAYTVYIVYTLSIQFQFCKIVEMKKMFKVQSSGKHIYFHYRADLGSLKDPENSIDDYKYGL